MRHSVRRDCKERDLWQAHNHQALQEQTFKTFSIDANFFLKRQQQESEMTITEQTPQGLNQFGIMT